MEKIKLIEKYLNAGLCLVRTTRNKAPLNAWKNEVSITDPKIYELNNYNQAFICGKNSGNLMALDFDLKYDITGDLYQRFLNKISEIIPNVFGKIMIQKTRNDGVHWVFRMNTIPDGNKKLASRLATKKEQKNGEKVKVLIETRGEGGILCCAPMDGYEIISGLDNLLNGLFLEKEEVETLFTIARSFDELKKEDIVTFKKIEHNIIETNPFNDYNNRGDILKDLLTLGWKEVRSDNERVYLLRPGNSKANHSATFNKNMRLFYVFSSSTNFEPDKAYTPVQVYCKLYANDDWKECAKLLTDSGYGLKKHNYSADIEVVKVDDDNVFWQVDNKKIIHDHDKFTKFLENNGFFKVKNRAGEFDFVKVKDSIIKKIHRFEVKDFVLDFLNGKSVYNHYSGSTNYFAEEKLNSIKTIKSIIKRDTAEKAYLYYLDKIVDVSKDNISFIDYSDIETYVWEENIIQRYFVYNDKKKNDFEDFIEKISGENFEAIKTAIGYLLHSYKKRTDSKAVIFYDETDDSEPNGRTGKTLIGTSLGMMKKLCIEDGKNWNQKSEFLFQKVDDDTQIFFLDDIVDKFNFEALFSVITGDWIINKKGVGAFNIPFADAPKIVCTSNYPVGGTSDSYADRKAEYEIKRYFNAKHKPIHEYKIEFWSEYWLEDDWASFDTFMIKCIQLYMEKGLLANPLKTIPLREALNVIGTDFFDFCETLELTDRMYIKNISDIYHRRTNIEPLRNESISKRLKKYIAYKGYDSVNSRDANGGRYIEIYGLEKEIPF